MMSIGGSCCFFPSSSVPLSLQAKMDMPPVTAIGAKAAPVMATKVAQPPLTGIGTASSSHTEAPSALTSCPLILYYVIGVLSNLIGD